MRHWTLPQVAVISLLAGLCEETLFRGVLQGGSPSGLGQGPALVVAAAVFGVCHWITRTYALLAALVGSTWAGSGYGRATCWFRSLPMRFMISWR
jgi:membrane protease YdiL (CAAX protease family)